MSLPFKSGKQISEIVIPRFRGGCSGSVGGGSGILFLAIPASVTADLGASGGGF